MNRVSRTRRLIAGTAAIAIGVLGAVAIASPASADSASVNGDAVCDTTTGDWVITWTVNNHKDQDGTIGFVSLIPRANISPIADDATVPGNGVLTATQRIPGTATQARLRVGIQWERPLHTFPEATMDLSGECTVHTSPSPSPSPSSEPSAGPTSGPTASAPASLTPEPTTSAPASPSPGQTASPSPDPDDGGNGGEDGDDELVTTGMSTGLIAGGAAALLALGAALFLIARRRRITFTA